MSSLKNRKFFTLIICCYNHEKYLSQCLKSILNQKKNKTEFDLILIDDCSKDNSLKIAKDILPRKNCIVIKNPKNIGLVKSCNKALKKVKTKYFIRVDSDDLISSKFISFFEKGIRTNPDFVFCDRIEFTKKSKKKNIFKMISCGVAMKTKKVLKIGGYKKLRWEEYDLYLRYLKSYSKVININKNLYFYRKHKKSMSSNRMWLKAAWNELNKKYKIQFLNKYGSLKP